jgi:hypothetical protein
MTENQLPAIRIEYRNGRNGWATATFKTGYGEARQTLETRKVRNNEDSLLNLSNEMKAKGYSGVSWAAMGTGYWMGETWI